MTKADWRATDPVDRFKTLVDQTMTISVVGPAVPDATEAPGGGRAPGVGADGGVAPGPDGSAVALPVSAPGVAAQTCYGLPDVTLTDPVMLGAGVRLVLAGVCAFITLASIGAVIGLAAGGTHGAAPYAVLGVLASLSLVAMVLLVMGLKSVTIRSGTAEAVTASA
jgi:hypothetical protein